MGHLNPCHVLQKTPVWDIMGPCYLRRESPAMTAGCHLLEMKIIHGAKNLKRRYFLSEIAYYENLHSRVYSQVPSDTGEQFSCRRQK